MTEKSSSVQAILRKNRQVSSVSIKTRTLPDGLRIEQVGMPLKKILPQCDERPEPIERVTIYIKAEDQI